MSALIYTHNNGIATITFNNPPQNRWTDELSQGLLAAYTDIQSRDDTRAILVKANGPDFSFGGDIYPWLERNQEQNAAFIKQGVEFSNAFEALPYPIIVAVQGHCLGGGFELALRGDIIIAAEDAKFGHPEATIGLFTLLGGVQRVAERVGRTYASQWALTAELIPAQKALETGLINQMVANDDLEAAALEWAERLANGPTLAHAAHKKLIHTWASEGTQNADALMPRMAGEIFGSDDAKGSIAVAIDALKAGLPRPHYAFEGK